MQWTYQVTNIGNVRLTSVRVTDDKGVAVSCPKSALEAGEAMTCTAGGVATAGQYGNLGTVSGDPPSGPSVTAADPSHYYGVQASIQIEKLVNGFQADSSAEAPKLPVGSPVIWTYVVVNTGEVTLTGVTVTDDRGVAVTCPKTVLAAGESMTCTAAGTAVAGLYCNLGTATATPEGGSLQVKATDPACYLGVTPAITIEKRVNGQDADEAPGPKVRKGSAVQWTYAVTNTGDVPLTAVTVTDDRGAAVSCPKSVLAPGEAMTCTANGTAVQGQYHNVGTVTGTPPSGAPVTASDPAYYYGYDPKIHIQKLTNGEDANTEPGPKIQVGSTVLWTYVVTNSGDITLTQVTVTDDKGVTVTCPKTVLEPAESMTCTGSGKAVAGQYCNTGKATGKAPDGGTVMDTDPSHYLGQRVGDEGCSPGYWKNHTSSWPATGYSTSQKVWSVFSQAFRYPTLSNSTLLQALAFQGGSGLSGAAEILLRAGVASLLNASHPSISFPRTAAQVITDVDSALASDSRDTMLGLAAALDADNNLHCPLN